jgi:hypothetical protein
MEKASSAVICQRRKGTSWCSPAMNRLAAFRRQVATCHRTAGGHPRTPAIFRGPDLVAEYIRPTRQLVSPARAATGTAACAATTSTTAGSTTFGRIIGPCRAGRCVRSAKGARIVASLRSCSVRRRMWSARCRAVDCRARARRARLCNAVACGIDLRRARICPALCERRRRNQQCCRSCYQYLLHAFPRSFYAPNKVKSIGRFLFLGTKIVQ